MMVIGVPKEVKNHEYRVGLSPYSVHELSDLGQDIVVEKGAGVGIGFSDQDYIDAGATILPDAESVFSHAQLIVKVKEPQAEERKLLTSQHTLFTYLHLAPDRAQTDDLLASGATCIAYETVTDAQGRLPLLAPMSEVAGRMSVQAGAHCLEKSQGGRGVLMGGIPGVKPATVLICGAGVVGYNAAQMAVGMRANVVVLDKSLDALRRIDSNFGGRIKTIFSTAKSVKEWVQQADLVIGAVLIPGAAAPKLITRDMLALMKPGAALVDVAIDQGGCFESSKPTTHDAPTFIESGIVHYCVTNMPGAVAHSSTQALNNATLPYVIELADKGTKQALEDNIHLRAGLNVVAGRLTCSNVAAAQARDYIDIDDAIALL